VLTLLMHSRHVLTPLFIEALITAERTSCSLENDSARRERLTRRIKRYTARQCYPAQEAQMRSVSLHCGKAHPVYGVR
jgi:hypothetical protein